MSVAGDGIDLTAAGRRDLVRRHRPGRHLALPPVGGRSGAAGPPRRVLRRAASAAGGQLRSDEPSRRRLARGSCPPVAGSSAATSAGWRCTACSWPPGSRTACSTAPCSAPRCYAGRMSSPVVSDSLATSIASYVYREIDRAASDRAARRPCRRVSPVTPGLTEITLAPLGCPVTFAARQRWLTPSSDDSVRPAYATATFTANTSTGADSNAPFPDLRPWLLGWAA